MYAKLLFMRAILFLVAFSLFAQTGNTPTVHLPWISAWYTTDQNTTNAYKWLYIDPSLTLYVDSAGHPHLTVTPLNSGTGILSVTQPNLPQAMMLDTTVASSYVDPPTGPGVCPGVGLQATDAAGYQYLCLQSGGNLVWGRSPAAYVTAWAP